MDILVSPIGLSMLVVVVLCLEGMGRAVCVFRGQPNSWGGLWNRRDFVIRIRPPPRPP